MLFVLLMLLICLNLLPLSMTSILSIAIWRIRLEREVPSCPYHPWKADEEMRGDCRSELKSKNGDYASSMLSVDECAKSCCLDPQCVTWQHRRDVGCYHGHDVRIGMEKDGPSSWCSDHAPRRWQGQSLMQKNGVDMGGASGYDATVRKMACDERTWNPNEEVGQCFGLGDVRPMSSGSSLECMRACCVDPTCMGWQWNEVVSAFLIIFHFTVISPHLLLRLSHRACVMHRFVR